MLIFIPAVLFFYTYLNSSPGVVVSGEPIVIASTPINPVETDAVFAFHCQVWNLEDGQNVHMYKVSSGRSAQLSLDDAVVAGVEERVFIASRNMPDGSVVYFLSIIDAVLEDQAEYWCKVITSYPSVAEVAVASVNVEVMYFPADSDLMCDSLKSTTVYEGDNLRLRCHSEEGNPDVSLRWIRTTDSDSQIVSTDSKSDGRIYSVANVRAHRTDNGAMFVCEVSNAAFPDEINTCHLGPIAVLPNPNGPMFEPLPSTTGTNILTDKDNDIVKTDGHLETALTKDQCRDVCDFTTEDSTIFYWVIATVVAAVLALIFCTVFVYLLLRVCRSSSAHHHPDFASVQHAYSPPLEDPEKIYVEVDSKRDCGKMYMSLVKPYPDSHVLQHVPQKM